MKGIVPELKVIEKNAVILRQWIIADPQRLFQEAPERHPLPNTKEFDHQKRLLQTARDHPDRFIVLYYLIPECRDQKIEESTAYQEWKKEKHQQMKKLEDLADNIKVVDFNSIDWEGYITLDALGSQQKEKTYQKILEFLNNSDNSTGMLGARLDLMRTFMVLKAGDILSVESLGIKKDDPRKPKNGSAIYMDFDLILSTDQKEYEAEHGFLYGVNKKDGICRNYYNGSIAVTAPNNLLFQTVIDRISYNVETLYNQMDKFFVHQFFVKNLPVLGKPENFFQQGFNFLGNIPYTCERSPARSWMDKGENGNSDIFQLMYKSPHIPATEMLQFKDAIENNNPELLEKFLATPTTIDINSDIFIIKNKIDKVSALEKLCTSTIQHELCLFSTKQIQCIEILSRSPLINFNLQFSSIEFEKRLALYGLKVERPKKNGALSPWNPLHFVLFQLVLNLIVLSLSLYGKKEIKEGGRCGDIHILPDDVIPSIFENCKVAELIKIVKLFLPATKIINSEMAINLLGMVATHGLILKYNFGKSILSDEDILSFIKEYKANLNMAVSQYINYCPKKGTVFLEYKKINDGNIDEHYCSKNNMTAFLNALINPDCLYFLFDNDIKIDLTKEIINMVIDELAYCCEIQDGKLVEKEAKEKAAKEAITILTLGNEKNKKIFEDNICTIQTVYCNYASYPHSVRNKHNKSFNQQFKKIFCNVDTLKKVLDSVAQNFIKDFRKNNPVKYKKLMDSVSSGCHKVSQQEIQDVLEIEPTKNICSTGEVRESSISNDNNNPESNLNDVSTENASPSAINKKLA